MVSLSSLLLIFEVISKLLRVDHNQQGNLRPLQEVEVPQNHVPHPRLDRIEEVWVWRLFVFIVSHCKSYFQKRQGRRGQTEFLVKDLFCALF